MIYKLMNAGELEAQMTEKLVHDHDPLWAIAAQLARLNEHLEKLASVVAPGGDLRDAHIRTDYYPSEG